VREGCTINGDLQLLAMRPVRLALLPRLVFLPELNINIRSVQRAPSTNTPLQCTQMTQMTQMKAFFPVHEHLQKCLCLQPGIDAKQICYFRPHSIKHIAALAAVF